MFFLTSFIKKRYPNERDLEKYGKWLEKEINRKNTVSKFTKTQVVETGDNDTYNKSPMLLRVRSPSQTKIHNLNRVLQNEEHTHHDLRSRSNTVSPETSLNRRISSLDDFNLDNTNGEEKQATAVTDSPRFSEIEMGNSNMTNDDASTAYGNNNIAEIVEVQVLSREEISEFTTELLIDYMTKCNENTNNMNNNLSVNKMNQIRIANELRNRVIKRLFKYLRWCKYFSCMMFVLLGVGSVVITTIYGIYFDLESSIVNQYAIDNNASMSMCANWTNNSYYASAARLHIPVSVQDSINEEYTDTVISDQIAQQIKQELNDVDSFGYGLTDTETFFLECLYSYMLSVFVWYPIILYIKALITIKLHNNNPDSLNEGYYFYQSNKFLINDKLIDHDNEDNDNQEKEGESSGTVHGGSSADNQFEQKNDIADNAGNAFGAPSGDDNDKDNDDDEKDKKKLEIVETKIDDHETNCNQTRTKRASESSIGNSMLSRSLLRDLMSFTMTLSQVSETVNDKSDSEQSNKSVESKKM